MKNYLGENIPKLGFGLMRLPMADGEIDIEALKGMVDYYMDHGFTYFDTAFGYHGGLSEVAAREALVKRHPRESFQLATKLPIWMCKEKEDLQKMLDTQLERAGVEYFDFYLLHSLDKSRLDLLDQFDAWQFIKDKKESGVLKHIGFSFHDTADVLDDLLTKHPEVEFVQLQINYVDWESESVQSRACYEVAMKHKKPVIIMEPVKGGALAGMSPSIQNVLKGANPDVSTASWAIRYCASLDGIVTVLSGMSNMEQIIDNVKTMENFKPLTDDERAVLDDVNTLLKEIPTIPCTDCKYCVDDCPEKINIPGVIANYNNYLLYNDVNGTKRLYNLFTTKERGKASACISCGACEGVCPQHIEIIDTMAKAADLFE